MPVFHTKTIESILEPVAQQVSKLVILHEEAEDGNAMPDLSRPVQVVKLAVDNLIKVGYETINNSEDQILKQDMPPALNRVEDSSMFLLDASNMLRDDPYSAAARKKLIEGSRGILQGTSALLLAFDESEVRKIIRVCKNVLEYLAITEVVDNLEDLVTFVKNLSPVLTKMAKEVDTREKELTHQVHREWLQRSLEQVRQLTPALISSIKNFITTKNQGGSGSSVDDATSSRDYVNSKMCDEIHEIIRVLQLTTYDEEEWDADDATVMKKAQNAIDGKIKHALNWLSDPESFVGSAGAHSLKNVLDDALKIGERCTNAEDEEAIRKTVSNINSMVDALCELKQQGEGNSPQATSLARGIQQLVKDLQDRCQKAVLNSDKSQAQRPAHTVIGKLEQAQRWLTNPAVDDKGLGHKACKLIIEDGLKMSEGMSGHRRSEMLQLCKEAESLSNLLEDFCRNGQAHSPKAANTAALLSARLQQIKDLIQEGLVEKVADDFLDISTPLKLLNDAAMSAFGTPRREENFEEKANNFAQHGHKMSSTAKQLAKAGTCHDRKTIEEIQGSAQRVEDLIPHVVKAARIVLNNPSNQASVDHFELLKKQWTDNVEKLRGLVDDAIDSHAFIRENEEGILADTSRAEQFIKNADPTGIVNATSSVARRSHRILQVAQSEADNSEDPHFVERIQDSVNGLRGQIAPVIQNAKVLAQNPRDPSAASGWRAVNQELIEAVASVRKAVSERGEYPEPPDYPPPPDMSQLHISRPDLSSHHYQQHFNHFQNAGPPPIPPSPTHLGGYYGSTLSRDYGEAPPRPPSSRDAPPPPRPPPPETDDEFENSFPTPQHNQPIMMAAHALHMDVKQWSSRDNELIAAAKKMALLMAKLSQLVRGEGGSKRDLIDCSRAIAEASEEVTSLAKQLAQECTDKRMRMSLLQVCERIPTMGTQLKILSTVKATMLGAQAPPSPDGSELTYGSEEDQEATEMLVGNAQNLMQSVRETVLCAEAASIKIRVDSGYAMRWVRRRPWYV